MRQLITSSRLSALRRCFRSHWYRYERLIVREQTANYFRFGSAFHLGQELFALNHDVYLSIGRVLEGYDRVPAWADPQQWAVERATVASLLMAHFWRYSETRFQFLTTESTFRLPLRNPATGQASRSYDLAGKLDAIIQLADGRVALLEYKTAGEDISPSADYWTRLRSDLQIALYVLAARQLGYWVETILYDVTRKPTIRLRQNETPDTYGERLVQDCYDRPDFYFQRRELPVLDADLERARCDIWQQAELLKWLRRTGNWFRNVGKTSCDFCPYASFCLDGIEPAGALPSGFVYTSDPHPELSLEGENHE